MGNKTRADHPDRLAVLKAYYSAGSKAGLFIQWLKNMYALGNNHLFVKALRFGNNTKMKYNARETGGTLASVVNFNMPSGWTCPKSDICKTFADRVTGKIRNVGPVECYEARSERQYAVTRQNAWVNYYVVKTLLGLGASIHEVACFLYDALQEQFPGAKYIRIHAGGDFFSDEYFQVIVELSHFLPTDVQIFGYTKVFQYVMYPRPENFSLVYSWGGLDDDIARAALDDDYEFGSCEIIFDESEAKGKPIACEADAPGDDIKHVIAERHFCLMIH